MHEARLVHLDVMPAPFTSTEKGYVQDQTAVRHRRDAATRCLLEPHGPRSGRAAGLHYGHDDATSCCVAPEL